MKKVLLGTSAIALAGAFATSANAAEWNVRVGGYYNAMVAYAETDLPAGMTADFDGVDVSTNTEIFFLPSITLDNGIKIGANIQLEAETSGDQIDESYVQIKGSFGEVLIGSENSAGYKMTYAAPNAAIIGINSPSTGDYIAWTGGAGDVFRGTLGTSYLEVGRNNDAKRITYFTPRMSGFQVGVSYAHDGAQDNFGPTDISTVSGTLGNIFDVGANYVNSVGGVDVAVSTRWGTGSAGAADPTVWSAGVNAGFGGFTVGGSFAESNEHGAGAGEDDGTFYDFGVAYATGPWKASFTYAHGENGEPLVGGIRTIDEVDQYLVGINYALAKGVKLNAFGAYVNFDAAAGPGADVEGFVIGTGIGLGF